MSRGTLAFALTASLLSLLLAAPTARAEPRLIGAAASGGLSALSNGRLSTDGMILPGALPGGTVAAYWQVGTDDPAFVVELGSLGGLGFQDAVAASHDGEFIVGSAPAVDGKTEAYCWTEAGGMVGLGFLADHTSSFARDVSGDGSVVVVGESWVNILEPHGFVWTEAGGLIDIGELPAAASSPCPMPSRRTDRRSSA